MARAERALAAALALALTLPLAAAADARPSRGVLHRVKRAGETYGAIAEHYYGQRFLGHHLRVVNRQPEPLQPGRTLIIPTSREVALPPGQSLEAFAEANLGDRGRAEYLERLHFLRSKRPRPGKRLLVPTSLRHVVRPGESLGSIARTYYRDASKRRLALLRLYNRRPSNTLRVGDVLRIPLDTEPFHHAAVLRRSKQDFEATASSVPAPPPAVAPAPREGRPRRVDRAAGRREVERAERLYGDGRYEECLKSAQRALEREDAALPKQTRLELLRLAGAALVALERIDEAVQAFTRLRRADEDYELDLYRTSPKILDVFESARP